MAFHLARKYRCIHSCPFGVLEVIGGPCEKNTALPSGTHGPLESLVPQRNPSAPLYFFITFIYVFVGAGAKCQFSPSTGWVLETELWFSCLAASTLSLLPRLLEYSQ